MNHDNLKIRDMAKEERPREKLFASGAESLSDAELLAILLGSGTQRESAVALAQRILNSNGNGGKGLPGLKFLNARKLKEIPGVGDARAASILALSELTKRISREDCRPRVTLHSPESVADYFMEEMRFLNREQVSAVFFNSSNAVISSKVISTGSLDRSLIRPRELFAEALKEEAASMILLHNHPSGNPEPSEADLCVTRDIQKASVLMGIPLLDHIIIGDRCYTSFLEKGLLNEV